MMGLVRSIVQLDWAVTWKRVHGVVIINQTKSDFANHLAYVACAIGGRSQEVELKVLAGLNTVYKVDRE